MKVRLGFVSNSSSSAYIVRGVLIGKYELKELLKTNKNKDEDEDEDLETLLRKRGCKTIDFTEPEYSDNEGVLGIWHGSVDNGCIEELPTASAKDDKRIEKDLKVLGLDGPVKTYVIGTSMG